jgi:hypothetical protein
MRRQIVGVLALTGLVFASGCGSDDGAENAMGGPSGSSGAAGASGSASGSGGGSSGDGGGSGASTADAGATGGSSGTAGTQGSGGCTPASAKDLPDEDFADTDCDGIDGNAASAVFVSPGGFDDAPGTREEPVQSVERGIELASERGGQVYVCNGTYRENVVISAPVSVYGGYDCTRGWKRTKDRAVIEPGVSVPLIVRGVSGPVHIERIAFRAADAVAEGQSAQAAGVVDSKDVTLVRVEFVSGKGANGADGVPGKTGFPVPYASMPRGGNGQETQGECAGSSTQTGVCARYSLGGFDQAVSRACVDSKGKKWVGRGGSGGRGGNVWIAARACGTCDPGLAGSPAQYHEGDGNWRDVSAASLAARGSDGLAGAGATRGIGGVENGLYVASNAGQEGTDGTPGFPGMGGSGAQSCHRWSGDFCITSYYPGSGGGQGGVGGCGGLRAKAGGAGGASLGLVVVNSSVKLTFPRFAVGDGGRGGKGARGGDGEPGGAPGLAGYTATASYRGADGQKGGDGGRGGDGGPGGGGPSIAVLYSGNAPVITDAVYQIGLPGAGGTATSGLDGAVGRTGEIVNIDESR